MIPEKIGLGNGGGGVAGFSMSTTYEWNEGLVQLPLAGEKNDGSLPCAIIRLHSPIGVKVVAWSIESVDAPKIPHPADVEPGSVFLRSSISGQVPVVDASGNHKCWRLSGTYYYALKTPHGVNTPMRLGREPGSNGPINELPAACFDRRFLTP